MNFAPTCSFFVSLRICTKIFCFSTLKFAFSGGQMVTTVNFSPFTAFLTSWKYFWWKKCELGPRKRKTPARIEWNNTKIYFKGSTDSKYLKISPNSTNSPQFEQFSDSRNLIWRHFWWKKCRMDLKQQKFPYKSTQNDKKSWFEIRTDGECHKISPSSSKTC